MNHVTDNHLRGDRHNPTAGTQGLRHAGHPAAGPQHMLLAAAIGRHVTHKSPGLRMRVDNVRWRAVVSRVPATSPAAALARAARLFFLPKPSSMGCAGRGNTSRGRDRGASACES